MKKALFVLTLAVAVAGSVFAGGAHDTVTVEGKLSVADGIPSITADGKTWVLPAGPFYQLAWENGVKIGDSIKAEGFEMVPGERRGPMGRQNGKNMMSAPADKAAPADRATADAMTAPPDKADKSDKVASADVHMFMPTRVWVNGKDIDLSTVRKMHRFGPEMGDRGYGPAGCQGWRDDGPARGPDGDRD